MSPSIGNLTSTNDTLFEILPSTADDKSTYLIRSVHRPIRYSVEVVSGTCIATKQAASFVEYGLSFWLAEVDRLRATNKLGKVAAINRKPVYVDTPSEVLGAEIFDNLSKAPSSFNDTRFEEVIALGSRFKLRSGSLKSNPEKIDLKVYFVCENGRAFESNDDNYSRVFMFAAQSFSEDSADEFSDDDEFGSSDESVENFDESEDFGDSSDEEGSDLRPLGKKDDKGTTSAVDRDAKKYLTQESGASVENYKDEVFTYKKQKLYFSGNTMVHELGHSFGLSDTYIRDSSPVDSYNRGTRKDALNLGGHDDSIMSGMTSRIVQDDIDGIRQLYRFLVSKQVASADECPQGYVPQERTGGCITIEGCSRSSDYTLVEGSCKLTPQCIAKGFRSVKDKEFGSTFEPYEIKGKYDSELGVCECGKGAVQSYTEAIFCLSQEDCLERGGKIKDRKCMEKKECEGGKIFDWEDGFCKCPDSKFDGFDLGCLSAKECRAKKGFVPINKYKQCVKQDDLCKNGRIDPETEDCSCKVGDVLLVNQNECIKPAACKKISSSHYVMDGKCYKQRACSRGEEFDKKLGSCDCKEGYHNSPSDAGGCVTSAECEKEGNVFVDVFFGCQNPKFICDGGRYNRKTKRCDCGSGLLYMPSQMRCIEKSKCENSTREGMRVYQDRCIVEIDCKKFHKQLKYSYDKDMCVCLDGSVPKSTGADVGDIVLMCMGKALKIGG